MPSRYTGPLQFQALRSLQLGWRYVPETDDCCYPASCFATRLLVLRPDHPLAPVAVQNIQEPDHPFGTPPQLLSLTLYSIIFATVSQPSVLSSPLLLLRCEVLETAPVFLLFNSSCRYSLKHTPHEHPSLADSHPQHPHSSTNSTKSRLWSDTPLSKDGSAVRLTPKTNVSVTFSHLFSLSRTFSLSLSLLYAPPPPFHPQLSSNQPLINPHYPPILQLNYLFLPPPYLNSPHSPTPPLPAGFYVFLQHRRITHNPKS
ncbi:hypothetical protein B0T26DRAFT_273933 [Lasiosphaeria miniovina]|uniref:Uncharacterized protein n=1 Tax=Lasiosphaeria miniovina TaxID=1954250 RepID=A0AA40DVD5_9PEZI|nr:uncharacterized protein B0T26DRAFT_273933 [Lasiosphaeria miniovina]KAK0717005.1 hypothetical protein B0T26DRAFT_273933 [Lasiosphaeria miniovina]